METSKPQMEDNKRSYLAMPLTRSMKLKRKRPKKLQLNDIFETKKNTSLTPVCKTQTKEIKKYEVRADKKLNQYGETPLAPNSFW